MVGVKGGYPVSNHTVITIGRQLGSGGREIGQMLAGKLGINYYDKELLAAAAKAGRTAHARFPC